MAEQFDLDYELDLFDGVTFKFGYVDSGKGEPASHDCPGEEPWIEFHYLMTFDYITCVSELDGLGDEIAALHEKGDDYLQKLMEAEYLE